MPLLSSCYCNCFLSPSKADRKLAIWVLGQCSYLVLYGSSYLWEPVGFPCWKHMSSWVASLFQNCIIFLGCLFLSKEFELYSLFLDLFSSDSVVCRHGYLGSLASYVNLQILR